MGWLDKLPGQLPLVDPGWGIPLSSVGVSGVAATARAGDLAQLAAERRAATLMAFAYVGETRAIDEALEMFYKLLRALTARVQRRGQAERLGTLVSLDAAGGWGASEGGVGWSGRGFQPSRRAVE